jgi:hypothetical protein
VVLQFGLSYQIEIMKAQDEQGEVSLPVETKVHAENLCEVYLPGMKLPYNLLIGVASVDLGGLRLDLILSTFN